MKKFFAGVCATILVPIVIIVSILLITPSIRHSTFRLLAEAPGIAAYYLIRKHVISRDFASASLKLNQQLGFSAWILKGNNALLPGVVQNAEFVIGQVYFPEEYHALKPFLTRLVKLHPDLLAAHVWLARAHSETDPKKTFIHLKQAEKIASSDTRIYRIAISTAITHGLKDELLNWCHRYKAAQIGGPHPYSYNTLFGGTGLRKLSLEVINKHGERILVPNNGLSLLKARTYEFALPKPVNISKMRLFFGTVPGLQIRINELRLIRGSQARTVTKERLILTSRSAFHIKKNSVLTAHANGEIIRFHPFDKKFGATDLVQIDIQLERLGLVTGTACERGQMN